MQKITFIEISFFEELFNRCGYVLNFSTAQFDNFTAQSVGVPLCQKYRLSKGASLSAFLAESGNDDSKIKLLSDLLCYYEAHCQDEIQSDAKYRGLYTKCKEIMIRFESDKIVLPISIENIKREFSSEYISSEIELMVKMQTENPTEAIGKAKELIESCCKTILEKLDVPLDKTWDINKLVKKTLKLLKLTPEDIPETVPEVQAIKSILGNLSAIAVNVAQLRNAYGSGHGKSFSYKGLQERHAKLAVGSSATLVVFLWDSYKRQVYNK